MNTNEKRTVTVKPLPATNINHVQGPWKDLGIAESDSDVEILSVPLLNKSKIRIAAFGIAACLCAFPLLQAVGHGITQGYGGSNPNSSIVVQNTETMRKDGPERRADDITNKLSLKLAKDQDLKEEPVVVEGEGDTTPYQDNYSAVESQHTAPYSAPNESIPYLRAQSYSGPTVKQPSAAVSAKGGVNNSKGDEDLASLSVNKDTSDKDVLVVIEEVEVVDETTKNISVDSDKLSNSEEQYTVNSEERVDERECVSEGETVDIQESMRELELDELIEEIS